MIRSCLAALLVSTAMVAPTLSKADIYALAIGIDQYEHIESLEGAVNDALDVTDALTALGADVITLIDSEATRERIFAEWRRLAAKVGPEDLLIVTYAGHGSNEPEYWSGNEFDGRDETLLLSGFSPQGEAAAHRIRDDEIAELLSLSPAEQTIFVGDACHSGTLSRSASPILGYRYVSVGGITDDPLPPPPPKRLSNEGRGDLGLFLAAVDETQKVPEFLIDGQPRGALSYAFASAFRGEADANGDMSLSTGEIEKHVRKIIRSVSRGLQRPEISSLSSTDRVIVSLGVTSQARTVSEREANLWTLSFDDLPALTLSTSESVLSKDVGATIVPQGTPADMKLDVSSGALISNVGGLISDTAVGEQLDINRLRNSVEKTRLSSFLMNASRLSALDVHFGSGDRIYQDGEIIRVEVSGRSSEHLTLFNIGSNGQIAYLYPVPGDPDTTKPGKFALDLEIAPPFGADHVVAVETAVEPKDLRDALRAQDGSSDMRALWKALREAADETEGSVRIALFPFFTSE